MSLHSQFIIYTGTADTHIHVTRALDEHNDGTCSLYWWRWLGLPCGCGGKWGAIGSGKSNEYSYTCTGIHVVTLLQCLHLLLILWASDPLVSRHHSFIPAVQRPPLILQAGWTYFVISSALWSHIQSLTLPPRSHLFKNWSPTPVNVMAPTIMARGGKASGHIFAWVRYPIKAHQASRDAACDAR